MAGYKQTPDVAKQSGQYRHVAPVAEGGYGKVALVEHLPSGELRCMKSASQGREAALEQEHRILSLLDHPNVIRVFDFFGGPEPRLYMEYVEDGNLFMHLSSGYLVPVGWPESLASTVAYLHSKKVAHRDLKSLNVLVRKMDQPILCDFGVSIHLPDGMKASDCFLQGLGVAPELVAEHVEYDFKPDVWALAAMIWEMTMAMPSKLMQAFHYAVVTRGLVLDPVARATAQELAETLHQACEGLLPIPLFGPIKMKLEFPLKEYIKLLSGDSPAATWAPASCSLPPRAEEQEKPGQRQREEQEQPQPQPQLSEKCSSGPGPTVDVQDEVCPAAKNRKHNKISQKAEFAVAPIRKCNKIPKKESFLAAGSEETSPTTTSTQDRDPEPRDAPTRDPCHGSPATSTDIDAALHLPLWDSEGSDHFFCENNYTMSLQFSGLRLFDPYHYMLRRHWEAVSSGYLAE